MREPRTALGRVVGRIRGLRLALPGAGLFLGLFLAGCSPAPTSQGPPSAPAASTGVTSAAGQALDTQPGSGSVRAKVERDKGIVDMNQVALFYVNNQADGAQIRESVLSDLRKNMPKVFQAVQSGDYVLLGGDPGTIPAGASNTVVAYTRDAPKAGGVAAFLDGHAGNVTAQEFQAAAKLGQ